MNMSFRSKVMPRTFWYGALGSAVLFTLRSRFLIYAARSVNRLQVVLHGFCVWRCDGDVI